MIHMQALALITVKLTVEEMIIMIIIIIIIVIYMIMTRSILVLNMSLRVMLPLYPSIVIVMLVSRILGGKGQQPFSLSR